MDVRVTIDGELATTEVDELLQRADDCEDVVRRRLVALGNQRVIFAIGDRIILLRNLEIRERGRESSIQQRGFRPDLVLTA